LRSQEEVGGGKPDSSTTAANKKELAVLLLIGRRVKVGCATPMAMLNTELTTLGLL